MKKFFLFICVLMFLANHVEGQQTPHYTQYMYNPFVINPALAGTHNFYQIRSNHRFQWVGITDPPITNSLSIYGPHGSRERDMGFGGYVFSDVTGPTSRTGVSGAYGYNIAVTNEIRLSMGVSAGIMQYKVDGTKIELGDVGDPTMQNAVYAAYIPDASVGLYLYSTDFHVGFSAAHLINNKLNLYDVRTGLSKLKSHFFLTGGYKYFVDVDWAIEPTLMIKGVVPTPIQMDISTKVIYQNMTWLGVSFRSNDAIAILAGYIHENKIYIGYSYDIGISPIRSYNSGSHEVMIGYRFNAIK